MFDSTTESKSIPELSMLKNHKLFGRPSTSSCSSKTSHRSRSKIRVPRFFSRFTNKNKKDHKVILKLGPPFTSTPDPSDEEGSVEYQESEYSSQGDYLGNIDDIVPLALSSVDSNHLKPNIIGMDVDSLVEPEDFQTTSVIPDFREDNMNVDFNNGHSKADSKDHADSHEDLESAGLQSDNNDAAIYESCAIDDVQKHFINADIHLEAVNADRSIKPAESVILEETEKPEINLLKNPEVFSKSCQTLSLHCKDMGTMPVEEQEFCEIPDNRELNKNNYETPKTLCYYRLFRNFALILLTLATLVNVSFWSFILGKVYYTEFQRVKPETSLICNLLSYTDSWWDTDYQRRMDCIVNDVIPAFSDQILEEAYSFTEEIQNKITSAYKYTANLFTDKFDCIWNERSTFGYFSAFVYEFFSNIFNLLTSLKNSVVDNTVRLVLGTESQSQNISTFIPEFTVNGVDEL